MNSKSFALTAGVVFLAVAVVHGLRLLNSWPVAVGSVLIPTWVSWVALLLAGFLCYQGLSLSKR